MFFFNNGNFVNQTDETAMTVTETGGRRGIVASTGSDMRKTNAGSMARAREASQELRVRKCDEMKSGQIIATSHLTPNGGLVREISHFRETHVGEIL